MVISRFLAEVGRRHGMLVLRHPGEVGLRQDTCATNDELASNQDPSLFAAGFSRPELPSP